MKKSLPIYIHIMILILVSFMIEKSSLKFGTASSSSNSIRVQNYDITNYKHYPTIYRFLEQGLKAGMG